MSRRFTSRSLVTGGSGGSGGSGGGSITHPSDRLITGGRYDVTRGGVNTATYTPTRTTTRETSGAVYNDSNGIRFPMLGIVVSLGTLAYIIYRNV